MQWCLKKPFKNLHTKIHNQYLSCILLHSCPSNIANIGDVGEKSIWKITGLFCSWHLKNILNGSSCFSEKTNCSQKVVFPIWSVLYCSLSYMKLSRVNFLTIKVMNVFHLHFSTKLRSLFSIGTWCMTAPKFTETACENVSFKRCLRSRQEWGDTQLTCLETRAMYGQ